MKLSIVKGTTGRSINVFIGDSSATNGSGLTALAYNTAGLTAYYAREQAASAAITLATLASATAAWSSGGFKEIDATNMPGWYRLDLPNAVLASGSGSAQIHLQGAANMAPLKIEIELTGWDNQAGSVVNVTGTLAGFSTAAKAEIQSEAEDALVAHNLDHLLKIAVDTNFATTVHLNSVIGHLADNGTSATFDRTTDSHEALRDNMVAAGQLDLSQAIPTTNTANTLGDCLNGARAQAFGRWAIDTDANTLTIYAPDGSTPIQVFDLAPNAGRPLARVPQ